MTLYRWQSGAVAQIECTSIASGKSVETVLRLKEGGDPKTLVIAQAAFAKKHIHSFIRSEGDQDALVIPETKNAEQVISTLDANGLVKGSAQKIVTAKDKAAAQKKPGMFGQENAIKTAAMLYNIGSITWIISGIQRGRHNHGGKFSRNDWSEIMVGVMNGIGSGLLSMFGEGKKKPQMLAFEDELHRHLKEQGVSFSSMKDASPEAIHQSGFFQSAHIFLSRNSVSALALSKGAAASFVAYSAAKKTSFNSWKLGSGMVYAAAWFATFALDKPHAPPYQFKAKHDPAKENTVMRLYHWASENPRGRIAAPIGTASQAAKIWGATREGMRTMRAAREASPADLAYARGRQYDFIWNIIGCSAFFLGNYMFGVSGSKKKSMNEGDPQGLERDLLAVSANTLASIPEKARKEAIRQTAEYIVTIKDIGHTQPEIEKAIADQIEHLRTLTPSSDMRKAL